MARYAIFRSAYQLFVIVLFLSLAATAWAATNTTTSLTTTPPSPASSVVGQPVTFTATVHPASASSNAMDGYVEFKDGSTILGVASITGNGNADRTATFTTSKLPSGTRSVTADYLGNSNYNASTSSANAYVVAKRSTTTTITSLGTNPDPVGQKSNVNVKVADTANLPAGTRGAFTATANSPSARTFFGQALLPDGTVLLIGGKDGSTFKTSQVFDPGAGTYSTGPSLNTARIGASVTALGNGRVLVIGGSTDGTAANVVNTAEIYDIVGGTLTGPLPNVPGTQTLGTARMNHTATLLDNGTVLIAGGVDSTGTALKTTEIFTPNASGTSGAFSALSTGTASTQLIHARSGAAATLLSGSKVLISGGDAGGDAEIYDASVPSSAAVAGANATMQGGARSFHSSTKLPDGLIVIMGGLVGSSVVNTVEFYDPAADSFSSVSGTMNVARQGHRATLLPNGTLFIAGGSSTSAGNADLASSATYNPPYDPQGTATITSGDGTDVIDPGSGTTKCNPMTLSGDGQPTCLGGVTPAGVNTNPHNIDASYADSASSHLASSTSASSALTVTNPITIKAADDTKTYDGTTAPSAGSVKPALTLGTLQGTDVLCATQTFATRNAGVTTTVSSTTGVIFDTTCGTTDHTSNYSITYLTGVGTINQMALTVTAHAADTKTYDGTTAGASTPGVTAGTIGSGDTANFIETFGTRNAGTGLTVTPSGTVTDGNSGNNYTYSFVAATDGVINQLATTITAATNTKTYDSNTSAAATPTASPLGTGDTLTALTEAYTDAKAGTGKTLVPSGLITDGNSGNNYTYTYANNTTGVISARALTVKAATNTKPYDTNTSAAATPTITSGTLQGTDTAGFTEVYANKNAGTGKTLIPSGVVNDGNGGANYSYTFVNDTTGVITAQALTVKALTNTKTYDATTSAAAIPTITSGTLQGSDTAAFTEAYSNKNAGSGKTLVPSGVVNDGNAGANYTYTFVNDTTGVINQEALTVTAQTNTKTYNGTTSAAALPTVTSGAIQGTDTAGFSETYSTRNAGSGLTLTPSGVVNDGNSGLNYSYTYVPDTTGVVNKLATTITAQTNTKTYDSNTSAAATPTASPLGTGDTITALTEAYSDAKAASGKTLIPSGVITDGNSGNNYTYTYVNDTTGVINKRALTVTAATNTKPYDGSTSAAATPAITSGTLQGTDTASFTEAYSNKNAGTGKTLVPSGVVNDGNAGANYSYTFVNDTTGVITAQALTVKALTNTKTYDATASAAAIPAITLGTVQSGDTAAFLETYPGKNVGTGLTLTPSGIVNDGNGGANYTYTFVNDTTGVIAARALTVTASVNTKTYDGTTSAAALPTVTTGAIQGTDTAGFSEVYGTRNAGTGLTLTPSGIVNDGNGGANYTYTYVNNTGTINQRPMTVTAVTNTKTYDRTTTAAAAPTFTALGTGDTSAFSEAYSDALAGTGKTLIPSGLVNDGNSGANYAYTYVNNTTGVINAAAMTITAKNQTKVYGSAFTFAGTEFNVTGLLTGDSVTSVTLTSAGSAATATFVSPGPTYSIVPSAAVGTGVGNYAITYTNGTMTLTQAPLTITAKDEAKVVNTTFTFAGTEFTTAGLKNSDTVTSASLSSAGSVVTASTTGGNNPAGSNKYTIVITSPVGTGLANYTITLVNGTMTVGAAPSVVIIDAQSVLSSGNGAFNFTATVTPQNPGLVPSGTVSFQMDGAAGPFSASYPCVVSTTNCKATATSIVLPAGSHTIKAIFNPGGTDFATSNSAIAETVVASVNISPGNTANVTANIAYPGANITITGYTPAPAALPLNNVNCVVVAAAGTVAQPPTCKITNTNFPINITVSQATAALAMAISTQGVSGASLQPGPLPKSRFGGLLAISMGMPAIVFMGLAVPLGTLRRKALRVGLLRWLGLALVVTVLLAAAGCGGGFNNPNNAQPVVSANASTPGKYTAIINYTDSTGTHALASVDFVVAAQ